MNTDLLTKYGNAWFVKWTEGSMSKLFSLRIKPAKTVNIKYTSIQVDVAVRATGA